MKNLILLFLFLGIFVSCSDDDTPEVSRKQLEKILYQSQVLIKNDTFDIIKINTLFGKVTLDNQKEYDFGYIQSRLLIDTTSQIILEVLGKTEEE